MTEGTAAGPETTTPNGLRAVVRSPAFLVGLVLLSVWAVTAVVFAGRSCPTECDAITEVGKLGYVAIGVVPGVYIVAGLLAPPRPFTTGFLLGVVHAALLWLHWLLDWPEGTSGLFSTSTQPIAVPVLLLVSLAALMAGMLITGWIGYVSIGVLAAVRRHRAARVDAPGRDQGSPPA